MGSPSLPLSLSLSVFSRLLFFSFLLFPPSHLLQRQKRREKKQLTGGGRLWVSKLKNLHVQLAPEQLGKPVEK
jgi:hypothetical protein